MKLNLCVIFDLFNVLDKCFFFKKKYINSLHFKFYKSF